MLTETNFTSARREFTELYNHVWHGLLPVIVNRRNSEEVLMMRKDQLQHILSAYKYAPKILPESDGSVTMVIDEFDIAVNGLTREDAIKDLVEDLKVYADDYQNNLQLFLHAPNRKDHFPFMLRLWLCENDDEIKSLLEM